jgi:hypothetical protein
MFSSRLTANLNINKTLGNWSLGSWWRMSEIVKLRLIGSFLRLCIVLRKPSNRKFLECADAPRADYLVIGNSRHFPKFWKKIKVITSREFIDIVAPHLIP